MGCCISCCLPDMNKHMEQQMTATTSSRSGSGRAGAGAGGAGAGAGAGGAIVGGGSPFGGPFAGLANQMAGGIMRQVGAQMEAAAARAAKQAAIDFQTGPYVQQDGLVVIPFVDAVWAFSPAYCTGMASSLSAQEYWDVLLPINAFCIKTAQQNKVADSEGKMLSGISRQLNAGAAGLGGMMQAGLNAAAEGQRASAVRDAIMKQVQPLLMRTSQKTAAKGVTWTLERHTWTTTSTTRDANGFSRTSTSHHAQYIIFLRMQNSVAQLAAVGAANGGFAYSSHNTRLRGNVPGCIMPKAAAPPGGPAGGGGSVNPAYGAGTGAAPAMPPRRRAAPKPPAQL